MTRSPVGEEPEPWLEGELDAIAAQTNRARAILSDAVERLAKSFQALGSESAGQLSAIEGLRTTLGNQDKRPEVATSADKTVSGSAFAKETTAVLTQFTDLLAQVSKQSVKTVYRIDDMTEELAVIFKLVASIDDIAEETSILAVNATIEAAHAGGAGRSFSIVAGHIRDLSKRTRVFNEEIGEQVGKARRTVDEVRTIISEMASRDLNLALSGKERVQSMLVGLHHFQEVIANTLAETNQSAARVNAASNEAIVGLQFEDILSQLLSTMDRHAETIRGLLDGSVLPSGAGQEAGEDTVKATSAVKSPVQQHDMTTGGVELF